MNTLYLSKVTVCNDSEYLLLSSSITALALMKDKKEIKSYELILKKDHYKDSAAQKRFILNTIHENKLSISKKDADNAKISIYTSIAPRYLDFIKALMTVELTSEIRQWFKRSKDNEIIKTGTHPDNIEKTLKKRRIEHEMYSKKY